MWTSACLVKTEEKEKMRVASRFNDKMLLLRVWRGLKNYKSVRKLKQLRHGRCTFRLWQQENVDLKKALLMIVYNRFLTGHGKP